MHKWVYLCNFRLTSLCIVILLCAVLLLVLLYYNFHNFILHLPTLAQPLQSSLILALCSRCSHTCRARDTKETREAGITLYMIHQKEAKHANAPTVAHNSWGVSAFLVFPV